MLPGLRDELITQELQIALDRLGELAVVEPLDASDAAVRLARHLSVVAQRVLADVDEAKRPELQIELVNDLIESLSPEERLALPPQVLLGVLDSSLGVSGGTPQLPPRPEIPLSMSDLLFNGAGQPTLGSELRAELASAERVDLICAFVIWSGVRILREQIKGVIDRGGAVRVITTTYMGATEPRAIEALVELGAEVKVAFDARTTKLHAKSWLIERPGELTTAFVGSSNLSHTALLDGLEWNVRLSTNDAPQLIERIRTTFESHWADPHFETYDDSRTDDLRHALGASKARSAGDTSILFAGLDVHPYPHQSRMLEQLDLARNRHDRHRNLVVAAPGTGKTVVAALDYRGLRERRGEDLPLLFVAHRKRILEQSRATFRAVLRDGSFGELLGDGEEPVDGQHVFAMIQSLRGDRLANIDPNAYDVVIVDEFHHAEAPTYRRLLDRLTPRELVGLTATPERMDGRDITEWFDGRFAVELRLWEAIDQGFLSPFQYFGVADDVDLSQLEWRAGGYVTSELENVYTGDHARVGKLLDAIQRIIADPKSMTALGFCVSVAHAEFMAEQFNQAGVPAKALSGTTPEAERNAALAALGNGKLQVVFSVDVLGEGVDVPSVDTVLLLRPTHSATVFTQQIGRGLRRAEGKRCLTVLDLVGQQHRNFRFDQRLGALLDPKRGSVRRQADQGFPFLPSGCDVSLDRVSRELIVRNLRDAAAASRWPSQVSDLQGLGAVSLAEYLRQTGREARDLYSVKDRNWTALKRNAGHDTKAPAGPEEGALLNAIGRMLHVDDRERVGLYSEVLSVTTPPRLDEIDNRQRRLLAMLHFDLWGVKRKFPSFENAFADLWKYEAVREELVELLGVLDEASESNPLPLGLDQQIPLMTHGHYTRDEVLAALGLGNAVRPPQLREGVRWVEEAATDAFFITLNKSERDYSPTTLYRDYAISSDLFHWESQSSLRVGTPTAERYIDHVNRGSNVLLFVRAHARVDGKTAPYTCLGPATYVSHEGERPIAFTWRLCMRMPESVFEEARAVAVA